MNTRSPARAAPGATPSVAPLSCSAVLTHHWLVRRRGGEKVLEALGALLPDAPLYTLVHDAAGMGDWPLAGRRVHTSLLQFLPGSKRHYPKLLPLLPWAARRKRLPAVELVVCSDAAIAKAMRADRRSKVVCYCHSPMRYVWDLSEEYGRTLPAVLRPLWPVVCGAVRRADRAAAARVDLFVANSRHVAERIRRHYGRDARIVHPPVELPDAPVTTLREDYDLCVGYHTAYKRLDLAIEATRRLGRRLVVIGTGPDVARVDRRRDGHVTCLGWQPDAVVREHYRRAAALVFAGEEDFGIVPVEALAHGCPVVAYGVGGATETVVDGVTGVLFPRQTVDAVCVALERRTATVFDPVMMHAHAQRFGRRRFLAEMRGVLCEVLGKS